LLISQCTLSLRKGRYQESIEFAQRAADILKLKAPGRTDEIGLALLRAGTAYNGLRKYDVARKILAEAKSNFDKTTHRPPKEQLEQLEQQLAIARSSGFRGFSF
jgi:tetratricopeptide (TPR) repeat protein